MQVFKFGGASVKDAAGVRNVAEIIRQHDNQPTLVVVSAMDKITNALELLANLATQRQRAQAQAQLDHIRQFHHQMIDELLPTQQAEVQAAIRVYLEELAEIVEGILLLRDFPDRVYDRIMAYGELISSTILHRYLQQQGIPTHWVDSRSIIVTDDTYRSARVLWGPTQAQIDRQVRPWVRHHAVVVTQGFIGSSSDGHTTTLGREGSDYTASIYGSCLDAQAVVIWKDVPGVMTGDPKTLPDAEILRKLSYEQAVEMTFYGASVIHPNTIKPLHNKGIPLYVRCFLDPQAAGTVISTFKPQEVDRKPTTILKKNQLLLHLRPRDFSFMNERMMSRIFHETRNFPIQINLVQSTAISLTLCVDHRTDTVQQLVSNLSEQFLVEIEKDLILKTILNVDVRKIQSPIDARFVQRDRNNIHLVVQAEDQV
ncbi:MAG: aspartate kinase [Bacteroidetes bacterium]|jgi:aspartate kinase|nr:aspartate kinase [Bacteroidota bacterium]